MKLMTHCLYEENAKRASLEFVPVDSPQEYAKFIADQQLLNAPGGIPDFLRRHSFSKVADHYKLIAEASASAPTIVVTRDLFDITPRLAAEKLRLPLRWIFGNPVQVTTWKLRQQLFADLLRGDVNRARATLGLAVTIDGEAWGRYPSSTIGLWPEWFARSELDLPFEVVAVGFIEDDNGDQGEIPPGIQDAIRSCDTAVLITAGTGTYLGTDFYAASAEACRRLNVLGILVAQHREQLPGDYPGCVKWVGHLPFGKLMSQVKVVIHHGGMGTLACAMAAGVPQLVLPKGADRPDNAARLKRLQIAEFLPPPKWQPALIADALMRLLRSPTVSESCREIANRLKNSQSTTAACETIEKAGYA